MVVGRSLGISAIVLASVELFIALKLIGAGYLVWIGFRATGRRPQHFDYKDLHATIVNRPCEPAAAWPAIRLCLARCDTSVYDCGRRTITQL
jgi:threonine/homoserine/homoserine lactone efflux protein